MKSVRFTEAEEEPPSPSSLFPPVSSSHSAPASAPKGLEGPLSAWAAIMLAAGRGTRMRSRLPKLLHPVAGKPMVLHVQDAILALGPHQVIAVVGPGGGEVAAALDAGISRVEQDPPLGTGDAVLQAQAAVYPHVRHLLVVNGDMPLVQPATLWSLVRQHLDHGAAITIATCRRSDPHDLGRVLRSPNGEVLAIVEAIEATETAGRSAETNEGIYCLDAGWVRAEIGALPRHASGEFYLTDLVARAVQQGRRVAAVTVLDPAETQGVNDRLQLSRAEAAMRQRIRERLMLSGVTMLDPPSTFVDAEASVAADTVLYPHTFILGRTIIGAECHIGPGTTVRDSRIGEGCRIVNSVIEESIIEASVDVGPFSHLRPGSYIETHVHLGNYVEVKNSRIGRDTAVGHFSYLGDATLGQRVNIGAGTITCNYDGVDKHPTVIGDDVFIGSDTMLVAPLNIGDRAATGAGAVVTRDVPPDARVVGVPARPLPERHGPGQEKGQASP